MDYEDEYTALKRTLEELNASLDDHQPVSHSQPLSQTHKALTDPAPTDTSSKRSSDMPNNRQPMHQTDRRQSLPDFQPLSQMDAAQTDSAQPDQNPADESHDDKYWYKQDAAMFRDSSPGQVHPSAEMQKEPSYARSHRSQHTDRRHKPGGCLTCTTTTSWYTLRPHTGH